MIRARVLGLAWVLAAGCQAENKTAFGYLEPPPDGAMVRCVVSGDRCMKGPLTPAAVHEMRTYYFCCDDCPKRFAQSPEKYLTP